MAFFELSHSQTSQAAGMTSTRNEPKVTAWSVAPRVGYIIPLSASLAAWPRAGLSYYSQSLSPANAAGISSYHEAAVDVDALLVWWPVPHYFIAGGPVADLSLSGAASGSSGGPIVSNDYSSFHIEITLGIGGWL